MSFEPGTEDNSQGSSAIAGGAAAALGFELPDEAWLRLVGQYRADGDLGAFGEYRLQAEIGRGGQGIVYRAVQPRTGRLVAIKRVRALGFGSDDLTPRFIREVRAAAALKHPNIVTVYGAERVDGELLMAMEYIEGVPVHRWAAGDPSHSDAGSQRRPPPDVPQVLRLFVKIADAIGHAHQRGVIHRDLKPSNVLVDQQDEPHVLDFGLACVSSDDEPAAPATMTAGFVGTPAYAAPEQFGEGDVVVDVRSDVYSLGCMLFQALTGGLWIGERAALADVADVLRRRDPPRPSSFRRELNREVDAIVLKALAKDKSARYQSMDAFADDLRRCVSGRAVLAHPPSVIYELRKFVRRQWHASLLLLLSLGVLLAAAALSTANAARERSLRQQAEQARLWAEAQEQLAHREAMSQRETAAFLMHIVDNVGRNSYGRTELSVRRLAQWIAEPLQEDQSRIRPEVLIQLHRRASDVFYAAHDYVAADKHDLSAIELARTHLGSNDPEVAEGLASLAANLNRQGNPVEGEQRAREAIAILEQDQGPVSNHIVLRYLGDALVGQERLHEAEALFQNWVDDCDRVGAKVDERVATRLSLGDVQKQMEHWDAARRTFEEALRIAEGAGYQDGAYAHRVREALGGMEWALGNLDAAECYLRIVAEHRIRAQGVKHYRTGTAVWTHGMVLHALGRYPEAEQRLEKALRWSQDSTPANSTETAQLRFARAAALLACDRLDEGRRLLAQAVSRGAATNASDPQWSESVSQLERLLCENDWRIDSVLCDPLCRFAWLTRSAASPASTLEPAANVGISTSAADER